MIINADCLPRLKGYIVVCDNGYACEIDFDSHDLIHPTIEAAQAEIAEWFDDEIQDDYLICEIDAPLTVVAARRGKRNRDTEANSQLPLFGDEP